MIPFFKRLYFLTFFTKSVFRNYFSKRTFCRWCIVPILFLVSPHLYSQDYIFEHLSNTEGLSQGNVWAIEQDSLGFMWIATEDGLNMYDGYNFTVFRNDANDSTSLSNDLINTLILGEDGDIWVGTYGGLNLYDRRTKTFKRFQHDPQNENSISHDVVNSIYLDSKSNLWVGTSAGLNLYLPETGTFKRYLHKENDTTSLAHNNITNSSIMEDLTGNIWIGTQGGISCFNPKKETFINFRHDPNDNTSISCNNVTSIYQDSDLNIWVGTFCGGLNRFKPADSTYIRYPFNRKDSLSVSNDYVTDILENSAGELLINTDNGLNVMNRETGVFKKYYNDPNNTHSLSSNITTCSFIDKANTLWVGTRFGGVNIYDQGKYSFTHVKHQSDKSLSNNNVSSFAEDHNGNYWVGTDGGGVNYLDRRQEAFSQVLKHEEGNSNSLSSNKVLALEVDKSGNLWIGTWAGGVNVYNPDTKKIKHYTTDPKDPTSISGDYIFDIMEDRKGNLWFVTWNMGLSKYDKSTGTFTRFDFESNNPNSLISSFLVCTLEDYLGNIWIGSGQNGLSMLNPETGQFTHYISDNSPGSLASNSIYSLYEDSKKRLWIGTNGGGLNLFNRETETFENFRKSDGLPNNVIMGIVEDNSNNIWVSTNEGLSMFNPEEKSFKNYNLNDGLQSNQFNRWAHLRLSTGELLFGGINGYNIFMPENIKRNESIPPVYITDLKLFNQSIPIGKKSVLKQDILFTDQIKLDYTQNSINIEYVALNYRKAHNNEYKYILEGFQDKWIDAGKERKATYTNLDPGTYTFKVKGSNNDGVWNENPASLIITITPPFWDTWYFKAGIILLMAAILISIYLIRIRVIKAQKLALEVQVKEKTESLSKINRELDQFAYVVSHDLKAPLRGIASLSEWIEEDLQDNTNEDVRSNFSLLKSRVNRMKDLIDGILKYSRVGRMDAEKESVNSKEVIDEVLNILSIPETFSIEVKGGFPTILSNRTWIEQIFTNLISNAIKYHDKDKGKIIISYHSDIRFHYFAVQDDGPGISEEHQEKIFTIFQTLQPKDATESTGIGLSIVKKIVEEHGGSIWVESDGKHGSKFIFTIPK